jgi:hypothetical protein
VKIWVQRQSFRQWILILQDSMCAEDFSVNRGTLFWWWFQGLEQLSFPHWFLII